MSTLDWLTRFNSSMTKTLTVEAFPVEFILTRRVLPLFSKPRKSLDHQSIKIVKKMETRQQFAEMLHNDKANIVALFSFV